MNCKIKLTLPIFYCEIVYNCLIFKEIVMKNKRVTKNK